MSQPPDYLRQAQGTLWVQWIFVCAFGWGVGVVLLLAFELPMRTPTSIAILTACLALGQWVLLRHFFPGKGWLVVLWLVATVVGGLIGQALSDMLRTALGDTFFQAQASPFLAILLGSFFGMGLGFAVGAGQFLVLLLGRVPNAVLWVLVNTVGWGIGTAISAFFVLPLGLSSLISAVLAAAVTGLGVGYFATFLPFNAGEG